MTDYLDSGAVISPCGRYRYRLWREWRDLDAHNDKNWQWLGAEDGAGTPVGWPKSLVFIMLNPSTADGKKDDPTIRKCVSFARRLKYERIEVVNLFAFRATKPKVVLALTHECDPVGWENQKHVEKVLEKAGMIICAWGIHGNHLAQDETMLGWITGASSLRPKALGLTKDGQPRHPLYLKGDAEPLDFAR